VRLRSVLVLGIALLLGLAAARAVRVALASRPALPPVSAPPPAAPPPSFSEEVPHGRRAVSIAIDAGAAILRELRPSDRVDVLATSALPAEKGARVSRVLLANVPVLGVKSEETAARGSARSATVAILVTPDEGMALAAAEGARFSLLLRNRDDAEDPGLRELAFTDGDGAVGFVRSRGALVERIPDGLRAITVRVRETDGISGVLREGDRVDVILTSPISSVQGNETAPGSSGTFTGARMISRLILQDVAVLATERSFESSAAGAEPVRKVTLVVTPREAERLAVASDATQKSLLRLVGRNESDRSRSDGLGESLADLLTHRRPAARVEVIRGGKVSSHVFYE
jgi:Flp pilus assembly protein CpaB